MCLFDNEMPWLSVAIELSVYGMGVIREIGKGKMVEEAATRAMARCVGNLWGHVRVIYLFFWFKIIQLASLLQVWLNRIT